MNILKNKILRRSIREIDPELASTDLEDDFEMESSQGFQLFPSSRFKLCRIRIKIRLLLLHSFWAALSIPLKIFAVSGCIAVAYSGVYFTLRMPDAENLHSVENSEFLIESQYRVKHTTTQHPEKDEQKDLNQKTVNEHRNPIHSEKISLMKMKNYDHLAITPNTINSIRFSSFPEVVYNNFRFIDFSQLYNNNKPILIPILGGLEARFENSGDTQQKDSYTMADTISYLSFLENVSQLLMNKNYNDAEYLLNILIRQRPDDENALYYKGYIHLCRKEFAPAQNYFMKCEYSKFKSFYHEAKLKRAFILHLNHQNIEAKKLIEQIENEGTSYLQEISNLKHKINQTEQQ